MLKYGSNLGDSIVPQNNCDVCVTYLTFAQILFLLTHDMLPQQDLLCQMIS